MSKDAYFLVFMTGKTRTEVICIGSSIDASRDSRPRSWGRSAHTHTLLLSYLSGFKRVNTKGTCTIYREDGLDKYRKSNSAGVVIEIRFRYLDSKIICFKRPSAPPEQNALTQHNFVKPSVQEARFIQCKRSYD
jgi:hypothetical protein